MANMGIIMNISRGGWARSSSRLADPGHRGDVACRVSGADVELGVRPAIWIVSDVRTAGVEIEKDV